MKWWRIEVLSPNSYSNIALFMGNRPYRFARVIYSELGSSTKISISYGTFQCQGTAYEMTKFLSKQGVGDWISVFGTLHKMYPGTIPHQLD